MRIGNRIDDATLRLPDTVASSVSAVSVLFPWKFHIGGGLDNIREIIGIRVCEKLWKIRIPRSP